VAGSLSTPLHCDEAFSAPALGLWQRFDHNANATWYARVRRGPRSESLWEGLPHFALALLRATDDTAYSSHMFGELCFQRPH
jgi:hypothetical protein